MAFNLNGIRMEFEAQRSLAAIGVLAGYAAIGTPLSHPASQILIYNGTDALLQFSIDGVIDHFVLPAGSYFISDINSNKSGESKGLFMAKGDVLFVKQIGAPTTGSVYFSVVYGSNGY